jgi:hypothetical protein
LLSSHYAVTLSADQKPPELSLPIKVADVVVSFVLLPFGVVWYWRGSWQVLGKKICRTIVLADGCFMFASLRLLLPDYWFWGLTEFDDDVNMSLLWSFVFSVLVCVITSEPAVGVVDKCFANDIIICLLGRLRTYIMAWGTVSFWRLVWLIWDQFLGGTSIISSTLGHVISILILTAMGCVSSICAPASTMGVDSVPHEDAADEPLFAMLPLPFELLHVIGIARQPDYGKPFDSRVMEDSEIEMGTIPQESDRDAHIDKDKKKLPDRISDAVKAIDECPTMGGVLSEQSESQIVPADEVEIEGGDSVPAMPSTSSQRGWRADGCFRSYGDLQRCGLSRTKSDYAQRPGLGNKRSRSKYFRSR